jgi:hypothetical protein
MLIGLSYAMLWIAGAAAVAAPPTTIWSLVAVWALTCFGVELAFPPRWPP